jgi:hypothetical protein
MNRNALRKKLDELGVNPNFYSLDGHLSIAGIVLQESYGTWTVFDLDERGNKSDTRVFASEDAACHYIYLLFQEQVRLFGRSR